MLYVHLRTIVSLYNSCDIDMVVLLVALRIFPSNGIGPRHGLKESMPCALHRLIFDVTEQLCKWKKRFQVID